MGRVLGRSRELRRKIGVQSGSGALCKGVVGSEAENSQRMSQAQLRAHLVASSLEVMGLILTKLRNSR